MLQPKTPGDATANQTIKNVTLSTFMTDVIQPSVEAPVAVYFWAPWCSTCKPFGPLLEKVVASLGGKVKLARVNIDDNPQIAGQFRIQSVPTVYVIFQGQPVDGFNGALPESELRKFFARFVQDDGSAGIEEALAHAAQLLEAGDAENALAIYSAVLNETPDNMDAIIGSAKALITLQQLDAVDQLLAALPANLASNVALDSIKAALTLARKRETVGDVEKLVLQLSKEPGNHQLRYNLAESLFAHERQEEAMEELLTIIAKDRNWNEEAARKQLVTYFEALGNAHPLTLKGRRRLSSILFS